MLNKTLSGPFVSCGHRGASLAGLGRKEPVSRNVMADSNVYSIHGHSPSTGDQAMQESSRVVYLSCTIRTVIGSRGRGRSIKKGPCAPGRVLRGFNLNCQSRLAIAPARTKWKSPSGHVLSHGGRQCRQVDLLLRHAPPLVEERPSSPCIHSARVENNRPWASL